MNKTILLFLFLGFSTICFSQIVEIGNSISIEESDSTNNSEITDIYSYVEEMPQFPGGDEAKLKFLQENLKFPKSTLNNGIRGTIYISFVVEKDGNISNIRILRGLQQEIDEEVMRVVQSFPKWKPGKQRGRNVRVNFNMPIKINASE